MLKMLVHRGFTLQICLIVIVGMKLIDLIAGVLVIRVVIHLLFGRYLIELIVELKQRSLVPFKVPQVDLLPIVFVPFRERVPHIDGLLSSLILGRVLLLPEGGSRWVAVHVVRAWARSSRENSLPWRARFEGILADTCRLLVILHLL